MKNIFYALATVALIALAGCENFSKRKYSVIITKRDSSLGLLKSDPYIIYAENDSVAYRKALDYFEISKMVADGMEDDYGSDYVRYPASFTITDSNGMPVFVDIKPAFSKYSEDEVTEMQKRAFAGADFGMSSEQVKSISPFNTPDWSSYSNYLHCYGYSLGDERYTVELYFSENKLYLVTFESIYYRDANYLDTDIKKEVENFRDIIKETYDYPTDNYGIPSILRLNAGYISWAYRWEVGTKQISVGIQEKSSGSEYQMYAEIVDTEQYEVIKAKSNEQQSANTKDASKQF